MGDVRVQVFTATGAFVRTWSVGWGSLWGIAANGTGHVYVADVGNDRVQVFTATGQFVRGWGSPGSGNEQFDEPRGIAVNGTGNVYVVDEGNDRVQVFTATGVFVRAWGSPGSGPGQFDKPRGIAVNDTGHVYVADTGNDRIMVFFPCESPLNIPYIVAVVVMAAVSTMMLIRGIPQLRYTSQSALRKLRSDEQRRTAKDLWRYWKITLAVEAAVIFLLPLDLYFCVWSCGTTFIPGFIFIFHLFLILVSTPLLGILVLPVLVSLILYLVAGIAANRDQNPKRWAWALRTLACGAAFVVSSALGYAFFYQFRIEVFQFVSPYVLVPLLAYHACLMACIQRAMKRATPGQFPRRSGSVTN